jgi:hypothetical protein
MEAAAIMLAMMQRLMIQAEPELIERTKRRASERGVSVAQVVRDAMEHELGGPGEEQIPPPLTCIGIGRSGRTDLSRLASEDIYEPAPWRSS